MWCPPDRNWPCVLLLLSFLCSPPVGHSDWIRPCCGNVCKGKSVWKRVIHSFSQHNLIKATTQAILFHLHLFILLVSLQHFESAVYVGNVRFECHGGNSISHRLLQELFNKQWLVLRTSIQSHLTPFVACFPNHIWQWCRNWNSMEFQSAWQSADSNVRL